MHDLLDGTLLKQFAEDGSESAFEILVERHSRLVFGVCLRIAGNAADAEEAAQATFIALALKAKRLDASAGLAGWLHRVARQVALDIRKSAARRMQRQEEAVRRHDLERESNSSSPQIGSALDEAIATLPGKLRDALIGHYLEGRSVDEMAKDYRCSPSTISMRLTRGRELLRKRLTKRGSAIAVLTGSMLEQAASAGTVAAHFAADTARLVTTAKAGVSATGTAAMSLLNMANEALRRLLFARLKWAFAGGMLASVFAVALTATVGANQLPSPTPAAVPAASQAPAAPAKVATQAAKPEVAEVPADPPLIAAIKNNNYTWEEMPKLKALLDAEQQGLDSIRDASGKTPLHWTIVRGWDDFCTLLLLRGANVDAVDNRGYTPLFEAIDRGDTCAKLLILHGANINHIAGDKTTPLTHAIQAKSETDAEILLWLGASTHLPNLTDAQQPLAVAKASGNTAMWELVQSYDDQTNPTIQQQPHTIPTFVKNAFHEAARKADYQKLEAFLSSGLNINLADDQGQTALHRAVEGAQPDVVLYLLMLHASPNIADFKGVTPLMESMYWIGGDLNAMRRFLILKGASPFAIRKDGFNELTWAVERDNEQGTQWLLWLGANGREKTTRGTPFQIAFQGGHQRIMDVLIRNGIQEPIKLSDDPVWNLHNAVKRGDKELVAKLLAQGVPVDAPDTNGSSPLIVAIATRNTPIAQFLIEKGADIHYKNPNSGVTPLYQTICWSYPSMTELREQLLKAGADPNTALSSSGKTALMRAVWHTPTIGLKQLIEYKADLNLRDKQGRTALGIAIKDGNTETAEYLRALGAVE